MTISLETVQNDLNSTKRHGFAFYAGDIFIAWSLTSKLAEQIPSVTRVVNVQNGAGYEYEQGKMVAQIQRDGERYERFSI